MAFTTGWRALMRGMTNLALSAWPPRAEKYQQVLNINRAGTVEVPSADRRTDDFAGYGVNPLKNAPEGEAAGL